MTEVKALLDHEFPSLTSQTEDCCIPASLLGVESQCTAYSIRYSWWC